MTKNSPSLTRNELWKLWPHPEWGARGSCYFDDFRVKTWERSSGSGNCAERGAERAAAVVGQLRGGLMNTLANANCVIIFEV